MIEELFTKSNSIIHRTQPVVRIVAACSYSFIVALMDNLTALTAALGFSFCLTIVAQLMLGALVRRLAATAGFLLLVWIILPLTYQGDEWAHWGWLTVSKAGVQLCVTITLKTFAIIMAFTALVATIPLVAIGYCLSRLGMPAKMVHLFLLAYRYIFVIGQEYQRLIRAIRVRSFQPGNNLHTYRTYAYLVGMLFVRASERARRVHQAMQCRGFTGRFYTLNNYPATVWNLILFTSVTLVSMTLIVLEFS